MTVIGGILLVFFLVIVFIISIARYQKMITKDLLEKQFLKERYEHEMLQVKLETQEDTFQFIGKELHDNIGQLLSTSRLLLGLTERNLEQPPETLLNANITIGQAINELRSLSKAIDPEWLRQFNFYDNLQAEMARMNSGVDLIRAEFICNTNLGLVPDQQIVLFRIVQEAIQNAVKHATPEYINILINMREQNLVVNISDNGQGFDMNRHGSGMGIRNMKHRTAMLGGSITWESVLGSGTTVSIIIPVINNTVCV